MPKLLKKKNTVRTKMVLHTRNSGHECEINWTIDNVLQFPEEEFISKIDLGRSCKTRLNFIVQVLYKDYFSDLSLGIERTDKSNRDIKVLCNVSIENSKGEVYTRAKSNLVFKKIKTDPELQWFTDIKFVDPDHTNNTRSMTEKDFKSDSSENLRKLATKGLIVWDEENRNILYTLRGHSITIKGRIKVFACCVNLRATPINDDRSTEVVTEVVKTEVMKDFEKAFESRQFSDITLKLNGSSVQAHKFVLAARSPVFKELLENSEGESELTINNMTKSVLVNFLYYLYSGIVGTVQWDMLMQLYEVAERFQVDSLKKSCRCSIISNLKDRRACETLQFAHKHKDSDLSNSVKIYMKNNFHKLQKTVYWESFRAESPNLAFDVYKFVTK
ncbi:BTB domain-containing protein [Trichonephila clavata]|uniref:BTB domain-containing protein n=1 Tax=Trichonephila clavata TaxID=2740835 RepID=A0A8X6HBL5_TRICU|nr:BTB domain-containing protein [Trichonephila clavata]